MRTSCPRWAARSRWRRRHSPGRSSYSGGVYQRQRPAIRRRGGTLGPCRHVEIALVTLAGPWGPYLVAATERGVVAAGWATTAEGIRCGPLVAVSGRWRSSPMARPPMCSRPRCPRFRPSLPASQCRPRRSRSISTTARASIRPCSVRFAGSAGARRRVTARSPDGSVRRGRHARSAGHSGATRSRCVIPCHRVIAADGTLGGYGGDGWIDRDRELSRKEAMLRREGVTVARRGQ